jgi:hypothetical protein
MARLNHDVPVILTQSLVRNRLSYPLRFRTRAVKPVQDCRCSIHENGYGTPRVGEGFSSAIVPADCLERRESYMRARFLLVCLAAALPLTPALAGPCGGAERTEKGSVAIEVRFITVGEDFFDRIGVNFSSDGKTMDIVEDGQAVRRLLEDVPTPLDEKQVRKFLEAVQGDIRSNVMQAPRMTVNDGQEANFRSTEQQHFVTDINTVREGGRLAVCPKTQTFSTGVELSVRPKIQAEKRTVVINLKANLTSLDSERVSLFPVVIPVTPVGKDGKSEKPVVFTQYLQQPHFTTLSIQEELTIPDGGSVLLGGWKRVSTGRNEFGPPVLSKVPYVGRLFTTVGYSRSVENVLMMVTARIITLEEKGTAAAAPVCPKKEIAELMKQFNVLFKEGKYAEAEACALRAHELDPDNPTVTAAVRIARQQKVSPACYLGSTSPTGITPCTACAPAANPYDPAKAVRTQVAKILTLYHRACSAGRLNEAKILARKALELDPACFDK